VGYGGDGLVGGLRRGERGSGEKGGEEEGGDLEVGTVESHGINGWGHDGCGGGRGYPLPLSHTIEIAPKTPTPFPPLPAPTAAKSFRKSYLAHNPFEETTLAPSPPPEEGVLWPLTEAGGLSHVLGRSYMNARFATSDVNSKKEVGLLTREFGEISQFHQGAGEDATLDLFRILEGIPNYSLLIIDEVEASLHPRAQRRLVRFLLWLCRQKKLQVILSTHSPYVLEELPLEASILLLPGPNGLSVLYGSTPDFALSRIDENVHPELILFVEDRDASTLLREIIRADERGASILQRIQISVVGPANVVKMLGDLAKDQKLPYKKALAVLDGDKDPGDSCSKLPGDDAPERIVFCDLKGLEYQGLTDRFGIGAGDLFTFLDDAQLASNHHSWTSSIGDKVLRSSTSVWEVLCNQWCKLGCRADDRKKLMDSIVDTLS
jgi:AAA domain, putative AbiEii toxin, Type IV TA system